MLWIMHTPHACCCVRSACLIISLCAFRIARMPIACKHFFTFLLTFSIMHNLACARLCIFKEKNPLFRHRSQTYPPASADPFQKVLKCRF